MTIPYASLFAKFEELADDLIEQVNATNVTLYFEPTELTQISSPSTTGPGSTTPNIFDKLGGRMPIHSLPDRQNEEGNNYAAIPTSRTIKSRVYWNHVKPNAEALPVNVKDRKDTCKVISYFADQQDLLNASYAIIDGYKCTRILDPLPHGLGGRQYTTSYWEIIG